jgi:fimbrial chaperone protein
MTPMFLCRWRTRAAFACLLLGLACGAASAAEVSLNPIRVLLDPARPIDTLVLSSNGDVPVSFEARALRWTLRTDGSWEQQPDDALLVQPLILTVPAGGTARLRVGVLDPADAMPGRAWRIELQELPGESAANGTTITLLTRLSLPVFVQGRGAAPAPALGAVRMDGGGVALRVDNAGPGFLAPQQATLRVLDARGRPLHEAPLAVGYVLAGAGLPLSAPLPAEACRRGASLALELREPQRVLSARLPAARQCGS